MMAALYLQVSIVSQALIFVTRSRSWSFVERPGLLLVSAFMVAQLVSYSVFTFSILNSFISTNQSECNGIITIVDEMWLNAAVTKLFKH